MELTLEQELRARVFLHKVAITKSAIANTYIAEETKRGGIIVSLPCLENNALEFADKIMKNILSKGKLDEAYDKAWTGIKDFIPDNFSVM